MPDLRMIDVGIGIVFLYILISIVCSAIRESLESLLNKRATYLEMAIRELLNDTDGRGLSKKFYQHSLINVLYSGDYKPRAGRKLNQIFSFGGNLPSYIPEKSFALAVLDLVGRGDGEDDSGEEALSIESIRHNVARIENQPVRQAVMIAIDGAKGDLDKTRENLETWFNSAMEAVSGQYRRATNWVIFWIAFMVAIFMNVDTFRIADYLYRNDAVRSVMVARAMEAAKLPEAPAYAEAMESLDELQLPIGWQSSWEPKSGLVAKVEVASWRERLLNLLSYLPGWLMTAFAATLGAPFWFDILKKVMMVRSSIKPGEKAAAAKESEGKK